MKCTACGEENVQNAKFCAFCGAKLSSETEKTAPVAEKPAERPSLYNTRMTAQPLSENPYQPHRTVSIPPHPAATSATAASAARESARPRPVFVPSRPAESQKTPDAPSAQATPIPPSRPAPQPVAPVMPAASAEPQPQEQETRAPRQIIKPAPQRVFLFDEEKEEEELRRELEKERAAQKAGEEAGGDEFEDDEEDYEDYEEEDEPKGGRIFVHIFSVLTVLALAVGVVSFLFGTTVGRRLRASMGMSAEAEDYLLLADWQLAQNSASAAADSYHSALKLAPEDYDLALKVGAGFENAGDQARAEQLYVYLIESHPQEDEPYDRLMALMNRQQRTEEYRALLQYRAEHQSGYVIPEIPAPDAPTADHPGGEYKGSVLVTLEAGGNEIRYTLDGTAPTEASLLYTGSIVLPVGAHNIRAVAVKDGLISAEWTGSYLVKGQ